jgi:hypothetical protein
MADDGMRRLAPLVGKWRIETSLAPPGAVRAVTVFEWGLGGRILIQRAEVDLPEAPDVFCVISPGPRPGGFTQHYFDSRGISRLYAMTFDDGVWTLRREEPDFTPLAFAQRYVGALSEDGAIIRGRWDTRPVDGAEWTRDFDLTYLRSG